MEIAIAIVSVGFAYTIFLFGRYCGYKEGLAYSMHRVREMFSNHAGLD